MKFIIEVPVRGIVKQFQFSTYRGAMRKLKKQLNAKLIVMEVSNEPNP